MKLEYVIQMNKLIFIEGPDKVGKTGLATYLDNTLTSMGYNVRVFKFTGPKAVSPNAAYVEQEHVFTDSYWQIKHLLDSGHIVICDRSYMGEYVYAKIYNRFNPAYLPDLHNRFELLQPLYIYVTGTPILKNATETDIQLAKQQKEVEILYNEFWNEYAPHKVLYVVNEHFNNLNARNNYVLNIITGDKLDHYRMIYSATRYKPTPISPPCNIEAIANEHPFWQYQLGISLYKNSPFIQCYNPLNIKLAIFGEAPGQYGCGYTHVPFYYDKSGMLLRDVFFKLGINMDMCFISNVFHATPPRNKLYEFIDKDFISRVNFNNIEDSEIPEWVRFEMRMFRDEVQSAYTRTQQFIAVGRTAYNALLKIRSDLKLKITIIKVYHPAYFLYKHMYKEAYEHYYTELRKYMIVNKISATENGG